MIGVASSAAQASPVFQTTGIVNTHVHSFSPGPNQTDVGYQQFNYLNQPQAQTSTTIEQTAAVAGAGKAFGRVSAAPGVLKAWSWSTNPAWTPGTNPLDYAASEIGSTFADTVLVKGGGLAAGTPVQYQLALHIEGTTSTPSFEMGGALATEVSAYVNFRDLTGATVSLNWNSNRDDEGWYWLTLDTQIGAELLISAGLNATTYVSANAKSRFAEADYGHSSYFYLAPSVADLNTLGASGHDFALPSDTPPDGSVPEPATLSLVLTGLLFGRRRRAGRSH
ncbi:PEP-CTERM sorting domain-containing protein [Pelomonas sp. V22]|uniref:PEP-CTERM sorting domain-containing protein n=1 Tax=Pelomonas sp. V22 TaxID=2822139 RepID=UPI0024A8E449|nr:PEP-CTERM sorting domain-containing protein [Pelomonas sp. V22]MDI4631435.1 PEP-CTERM sorting domain-containing protein [Pelomonas sp. V22]